MRGTPENTLRAYERDLVYLAAWVEAAFGKPLDWPETEAIALRFILDHSRDLTMADGKARHTAEALIRTGSAQNLGLPCPGNT